MKKPPSIDLGALLPLAGLLFAACSSASADASDASPGRGGSTVGTGGKLATGGTVGSGGFAGAGGSSAGGLDAGGTRAGGRTGGNAIGVGTGGNATTGGNVTTGGSRAGGVATGGTSNAGGSRTGGRASTGGFAVTGGNANTGGHTNTGGTIVNDCSVLPPAGSPVAAHGQLKVVGTRIQDQSGAELQLKGISSMWLNWENPKYAESKAALQYMRDNWKLTVFRIAMGIEVTDGYLAVKAGTQARVDTIVQNALSLGLYVIIDWHTERAVDQTNESVAFFTGMADKYGKCPNIIYETYNEPTKVTWAQIKPYHTTVVAAIRAEDPDNLIILGTPDWSSGVDKAAADPVTGTNLLYTLHFYACAHAAASRTTGDAAIAKGLALFITEFGLTPADGGVPPNNKVCESEGSLWFDWMAQNGVSGTGWKLVSGVDSSNIFSSTSKPPVDGPFPDSSLSQTNGSSPGHGQAIVNWLRK